MHLTAEIILLFFYGKLPYEEKRMPKIRYSRVLYLEFLTRLCYTNVGNQFTKKRSYLYAKLNR